MRNTQVTQLPPTSGVQDPHTRAFLDALANAWDTRSGHIDESDPNRFITKREINELTTQAIVDALAPGVIGGSNGVGNFGQSPSAAQVNQAIDNLADSIRRSLLYQLLGTATLDTNLITSITQSAEAGISEEQTIRQSKDSALASAINNIWASIGGSSAVIQDASLAAATPSTASATKWTQVVASVTDPNTGLVNATSIKEDLNSYANTANGTFNSIYSVRAETSVGGQTVIGGFGLAATAGAGSAAGPTIDFGVRADRFYVAATAGTPSAAAQIAQGSSIPFMVLTSTQTVNGVPYAPGVYIKKAVIGAATIGEAEIADAAITNAKIGNFIQSDNYIQGVSGWKIGKTSLYTDPTFSTPVMAEFNGVVMSRPQVVASGTNTYANGVYQFNILSASPQRIEIVFDTGYNDLSSILDVKRPALVGRAVVSNGFANWSSDPGSNKYYEMRCEVELISSVDHFSTGASGAVPGGRIYMRVTVHFPQNIAPYGFASVSVTGIRWSLMRVT